MINCIVNSSCNFNWFFVLLGLSVVFGSHYVLNAGSKNYTLIPLHASTDMSARDFKELCLRKEFITLVESDNTTRWCYIFREEGHVLIYGISPSDKVEQYSFIAKVPNTKFYEALNTDPNTTAYTVLTYFIREYNIEFTPAFHISLTSIAV